MGFNATEPVYGHLFRSMLRENNDSIYLSDYVKPMLELEIAYIFGADVTYPLTLEDLQAAVGPAASVAPMAAVIISLVGLPAQVGIVALVETTAVVIPMVVMTHLFGSCATTTILSSIQESVGNKLWNG